VAINLDLNKLTQAIQSLGALSSICLFLYVMWTNGRAAKIAGREAAKEVIKELSEGSAPK
jgi:hypothetical protein